MSLNVLFLVITIFRHLTVGQIYAAAEFYDYDAKYNNAESKTVIPANISNEKAEEIRKKAIEILRYLTVEVFQELTSSLKKLEPGTLPRQYSESSTRRIPDLSNPGTRKVKKF